MVYGRLFGAPGPLNPADGGQQMADTAHWTRVFNYRLLDRQIFSIRFRMVCSSRPANKRLSDNIPETTYRMDCSETKAIVR